MCRFVHLKCEVVGVAVMDALLCSGDADNRQHGAKGLLPCQPHVWPHVVHQQGPDEIALAFVLLQEKRGVSGF